MMKCNNQSGHCIGFQWATKEPSRCYYVFEALLGESHQDHIALLFLFRKFWAFHPITKIKKTAQKKDHLVCH